MPKLTNDVKLYIVQHLACYDSPSEVVDSVKVLYNLNVSRQQVEAYDPTKQAGSNLHKKWRAIFEAVREKFVIETSAIPIANRAYRLRAIDRMYRHAIEKGNISFGMKLLEQAAKECGNIYENRKMQHPKTTGTFKPKGDYVLESQIGDKNTH